MLTADQRALAARSGWLLGEETEADYLLAVAASHEARHAFERRLVEAARIADWPVEYRVSA
jgi:hypothetical protein